MEPVIEGTSDPLELIRYNWISIGLMLSPGVIVRGIIYVVAVIAGSILLIRCGLRQEHGPRHHHSHRY